MNQHTSFKDLKAKISERGVCTNVAIQQMLVAEHIQEMNKCRVEEATIDSTVQPSPAPIKILSSMRRRFSQHCDSRPSLNRFAKSMRSLATPSAPSTIPVNDERVSTHALDRSVIPVPRVPSLSTASTILEDKRFLARAFQRRSEENLQKLVWLRPAATFYNDMAPKTTSRLQLARKAPSDGMAGQSWRTFQGLY
jgi:hypothetical protein